MQGLPLLTLAGLLAAAVASYASAHAQHSRELLVGSDSDDALEVGRDTKHQANPCPPDLLQEGVIENFTPLVKSKTELGYNPFLPVRCAVKTFSQLRKVVQDSRVDEVIVMQDMEMPEWDSQLYGGALIISQDIKIIGACVMHDEKSLRGDYFPLRRQLPHYCVLSAVTGRLLQISGGARVKFYNMHLMGGHDVQGGCVSVTGNHTRAKFTDCAFSQCTAMYYGGAVSVRGAAVAYFHKSHFYRNHANLRGGAVVVASTSRAYIDQCDFASNSCGDVSKGMETTLETGEGGSDAAAQCDEGVDVWVDAHRPVIRTKQGGIWV